MLPKLQSLRSLRRVFFGIATNYKERLDKAITRLGRVDYDWAVLPPDLLSRLLLLKKFNSMISDTDARTLAANTMFFSYLELKRTVKNVAAGLENPWNTVKHPTGSPEGYGNRIASDDEFVALLNTLITKQAADLATVVVRNNLQSQLNTLRSKSEARRKASEVLFLKETEDEIKKAVTRLK